MLEIFNFVHLHFIPGFLHNSSVIKLHWEPKCNRTRHFCFLFRLSFTKTVAVDYTAYFLDEEWDATFVTQDEIFLELFFSGSRFFIEEALSFFISLLSWCNNMWCLHPFYKLGAYTPSYNVQIVNNWKRVSSVVWFLFFIYAQLFKPFALWQRVVVRTSWTRREIINYCTIAWSN